MHNNGPAADDGSLQSKALEKNKRDMEKEKKANFSFGKRSKHGSGLSAPSEPRSHADDDADDALQHLDGSGGTGPCLLVPWLDMGIVCSDRGVWFRNQRVTADGKQRVPPYVDQVQYCLDQRMLIGIAAGRATRAMQVGMCEGSLERWAVQEVDLWTSVGWPLRTLKGLFGRIRCQPGIAVRLRRAISRKE